MIIAEGEDTALWVGLSNAITAIIVAAGAVLLNWLRTRQETVARADAARQETTARAEIATNEEYRKLVKAYEARVTRLEKRIDQQDDEIAGLAEKYRLVLVLEARCEERLKYYEDVLRGNGIPFKPYAADGDNSSHEAERTAEG